MTPPLTAEVIQSQRTLDDVIELLRASHLPHGDVKWEGNLMIAYRQGDEKELVGSGGLELYGSYALLRSVVVSASSRGQSIGQHIVDDLLERARVSDITAVYLLTETARGFFAKKGFHEIERQQVPGAVTQSSEFTSVCPVSAACMVYHL